MLDVIAAAAGDAFLVGVVGAVGGDDTKSAAVAGDLHCSGDCLSSNRHRCSSVWSKGWTVGQFVLNSHGQDNEWSICAHLDPHRKDDLWVEELPEGVNGDMRPFLKNTPTRTSRSPLFLFVFLSL